MRPARRRTRCPPDEEQFHRRVWRAPGRHRPPTTTSRCSATGLDHDELLRRAVSRDGRWLLVTASAGTAPPDDVWIADLHGERRRRRRRSRSASTPQTGAWIGPRRPAVPAHRPRRARAGRLAVTDPAAPAYGTGSTLVAEDPDAVLEDVALPAAGGAADPRRRPARARRAAGTPRRAGAARARRARRAARVRAARPRLAARRHRRRPRRPERERRALDRLDRPRHAAAGPPVRPRHRRRPTLGGRSRRRRGAAGAHRAAERSPPPTARRCACSSSRARARSADRGPTAPLRLRRLQHLARPRLHARPRWPGSRPAASTRSPTCAAAARRARTGTAPACATTSRTCSTTSTPPRERLIAPALDHAGRSSRSSAAPTAACSSAPRSPSGPTCSRAVVCSRTAAGHGPLRAVRPRPHLERRVRHRRRPAELGWLLGYSPYHRVRDGTAYPAVLFTVFEGDTRVDPLHARKLPPPCSTPPRRPDDPADAAAPGDRRRARRPVGDAAIALASTSCRSSPTTGLVRVKRSRDAACARRRLVVRATSRRAADSRPAGPVRRRDRRPAAPDPLSSSSLALLVRCLLLRSISTARRRRHQPDARADRAADGAEASVARGKATTPAGRPRGARSGPRRSARCCARPARRSSSAASRSAGPRRARLQPRPVHRVRRHRRRRARLRRAEPGQGLPVRACSCCSRTSTASATSSTSARRPARSRRSACGSPRCATSTARSGTSATARSCGSATRARASRVAVVDLPARATTPTSDGPARPLAAADELVARGRHRRLRAREPQLLGVEKIGVDGVIFRVTAPDRPRPSSSGCSAR